MNLPRKNPVREYLLVFAALLVLLALAVLTAEVGNRAIRATLAASITVAKASLIMLYFMHLRQSSGLVRNVAVSGFLWLAFLFGLLGSDYLFR